MINYLDPNFSDLPGRRSLPRMYSQDLVVSEKIDVSIITPYYNTEALFVETFISLQNQSLQNWEWVIVDDGSLDQESVGRLLEIAEKDVRIKVIHQENAGPAAARNTAFRNTRSRYICLLDSDDMIEPTYLEKCIWFLESNPQFAFCNAYSVIFGDQQYLWTTGFERGKAHLRANSGPPISMIRRNAYLDCGGFDESIRFGHEDWDFWLAMAKTGHWGYTIPEFLQWYRKRGTGRFEQIMKTDGINDAFEKLMHSKYDGLDKNFPSPSRSHPAPYENIETKIHINNRLSNNPTGRRIMFIVPWMVTGGADRVNIDLIDGLTSKGHDVTVCASLASDHKWEHEFSRFTPDIFVLPNFLHISDYPRFLEYLIQSRQIDTVVITGSTLGYQFLPYLRAVSPNVAFVDMSHVQELHWLNGGHPRFGVGYQDLLDLNITTTRNLSEWMETRGADASRIRVMYTGVRPIKPSIELRHRIREELGVPADIPLIVFAGRICEQKRPAMLAQILKCAHDQGLVFRAVIIGDGELKYRFEELIDEYQLTTIIKMLGSIQHSRWLEILASSDILLMPSKYEGISIALLEAIAAGCVPIVAKVGGQNEIVDTNTGFLIPHSENELQEYVQALRSLLTDSSRLESMSKQCKLLADNRLSWSGMIDNFLNILNEAHHLRQHKLTSLVTPKLGRELVTLALECKRLSDAVDWLWNAKPENSPITGNSELLTPSAEAQAVARFAVGLSQTRLGQALIRNKSLRVLARYLLNRLIKPTLS